MIGKNNNQGGSRIIDLGTATSFNVADYYNGDVSKLTVDNFLIAPSGTVTRDEYHETSSSKYYFGGKATIVSSYNNATGVLTCYLAETARHRQSDQGTSTVGLHAYLKI